METKEAAAPSDDSTGDSVRIKLTETLRFALREFVLAKVVSFFKQDINHTANEAPHEAACEH